MRKRTRTTFNWVYVIIKWFSTNIALGTDGRVTIFNGNNVKIGVNIRFGASKDRGHTCRGHQGAQKSRDMLFAL